MKKLSLIFIIGLLLISIMSFAGCGGEGDTIYVNNVSEDSSSSSIGTEGESSSSSGISSIGESNSSSSGVKQIPTSSSSSISSSSVFVSDGTCDSLITPFTRTYSSYLAAGSTGSTGILRVTLSEVDSSIPRYEAEITIEVRKDSTFFTFDKEEGYSYKYQNVSCETFDGELWIYSEEVFDNELNKDVSHYTLISDINGVWDMFSLREQQYWVMGDSPYIDSIYWDAHL